jgi:hypothetical protein
MQFVEYDDVVEQISAAVANSRCMSQCYTRTGWSDPTDHLIDSKADRNYDERRFQVARPATRQLEGRRQFDTSGRVEYFYKDGLQGTVEVIGVRRRCGKR